MSDASGFLRVRPDERRAADPTPGKLREEAIAVDGLWSSTASQEVITRFGSGPLTINVDGPEPPAAP